MTQTTAKRLCSSAGIGWHEADNATELAADLASFVATTLQQQIDAQGQASLVVSGGSTPAPVFERLACAAIDWAKVSITLADERWVPPGHADSNESLVRDTLLVDKAAAAQFVALYRDGVTPEDAVTSVAADVQAMTQPFTVTILGMGGDGHTASLFPDAPDQQLSRAMNLDNAETVAILTPPSVPQTRISLTRAALLNSRYRILHLTGEGKQQVLADALQHSASDGQMPGQYNDSLLPIVGLLSTKPEDATVYWSP